MTTHGDGVLDVEGGRWNSGSARQGGSKAHLCACVSSGLRPVGLSSSGRITRPKGEFERNVVGEGRLQHFLRTIATVVPGRRLPVSHGGSLASRCRLTGEPVRSASQVVIESLSHVAALARPPARSSSARITVSCSRVPNSDNEWGDGFLPPHFPIFGLFFFFPNPNPNPLPKSQMPSNEAISTASADWQYLKQPGALRLVRWIKQQTLTWLL